MMNKTLIVTFLVPFLTILAGAQEMPKPIDFHEHAIEWISEISGRYHRFDPFGRLKEEDVENCREFNLAVEGNYVVLRFPAIEDQNLASLFLTLPVKDETGIKLYPMPSGREILKIRSRQFTGAAVLRISLDISKSPSGELEYIRHKVKREALWHLGSRDPIDHPIYGSILNEMMSTIRKCQRNKTSFRDSISK